MGQCQRGLGAAMILCLHTVLHLLIAIRKSSVTPELLAAYAHSTGPNDRVRNNRGEVDEVKQGKNRNKSRIRARVEHVFCVVKRLWGFNKVRYRGLAKNATRAFTALALANIYLGRGQLMAQVRP